MPLDIERWPSEDFCTVVFIAGEDEAKKENVRENKEDENRSGEEDELESERVKKKRENVLEEWAKKVEQMKTEMRHKYLSRGTEST